MSFQHSQVPLEAVAHPIDRQIAALVLNLGGKHHQLSLGLGGLDPAVKFPLGSRGNAPHSVALNDNGVALRQKKGELGGRDAGDQLEKGDLLVQSVVEPKRAGDLRAQVWDQPPVLHHPQNGIVDAGKGAIALRVGLSGPGAQDDLSAEDHADPGDPTVAGHGEAVQQVGLGVGDVGVDGPLTAGEDYGLGAVLDEIAQSGGGVGHGVGTMADHKAVVAVIAFPDGPGDEQPVGGSHVGGVDAAYLKAVHPAQVPQGGDVGEQILAVQVGGQARLGHFGSDGASGSDHKDPLHGEASFLFGQSRRLGQSPAACPARKLGLLQSKVLLLQPAGVQYRRFGGDPLQGVVTKTATAAVGADHALFGAENTALLQRGTLGTVSAAGVYIFLKQRFLSKHDPSPSDVALCDEAPKTAGRSRDMRADRNNRDSRKGLIISIRYNSYFAAIISHLSVFFHWFFAPFERPGPPKEKREGIPPRPQRWRQPEQSKNRFRRCPLPVGQDRMRHSPSEGRPEAEGR